MKNPSILVIDDDKQLNHLLKKQLSKEGYEVFLAHDGEEGLKLVNDIKPQMVILDIMLPNIDGYEVLKLIKENEAVRDTPVILHFTAPM